MRDSTPSWQKKLAEGFSRATELLEFLNLPPALANHLAEQQFKTRVPRGFAARMIPEDPHDPLLLQVLAVEQELENHEGFVSDPVGDAKAIPCSGLIHKYHGRVLLTLTGSCAINCRYCFRRHFPYQDNNPGRQGWQKTLAYVNENSHITEVILSGGDPLLVKDAILAELIEQLEAIPHLHTLRIHTRIPVVLPERINREFVNLLTASRLNKVVILHSNHPRELDEQVKEACKLLRESGSHLLNQSVLLAGVNNKAETLKALSEQLLACGVLPYYLHVLDKVQGAAHFDVSLDEAKRIFKELQELLPGYLVPRLVREDAGEKHKTLI
jgi:EF-P beta-lysylation protein EpmB